MVGHRSEVTSFPLSPNESSAKTFTDQAFHGNMSKPQTELSAAEIVTRYALELCFTPRGCDQRGGELFELGGNSLRGGARTPSV